MEKHLKQSSHSTPEEQQKSFFKKLWGPRLLRVSLFISAFLLSIALIARIDQAYRVGTLTLLGEQQDLPFIGKTQFAGTHTWNLSEEYVTEYLSEANPGYEVVSVSISYPATVVVELKKHVPAAYFKVSDGYLLLSQDGVILSKSHEEPPDTHPVIAFYQELPYNAYQRGDRIGYKDAQDSLYFLDIIQAARIKVNRIDISSFFMLGLYTDRGTFLFTSEKDRELQKYQFEESLKQVSIEGIQFDTLDFRFDKPIVRT